MKKIFSITSQITIVIYQIGLNRVSQFQVSYVKEEK
jgi:hypothetical protein